METIQLSYEPLNIANESGLNAAPTATYLAPRQLEKLHGARRICNANHGVFCNGNMAPKTSS